MAANKRGTRTSPARGSRRRDPSKPADQEQGAARSRTDRADRRRRETRRRLLRAAFVLMAERGVDGVAINEITESADVGFGSFYNHFESKEAIHAVVAEEVLTSFGEALSHVAESLEDPAEILAASVRYVALRARREPLWGRFLLRSALSMDDLSHGIGRYLLRDVQRGIDAGRFRSDDRFVTVMAVGGTAIAAVTAGLETSSLTPARRRALRRLGFETRELPERAASAVLRILGLPAAEADEIARRPLPPVDLPASAL